MASLESQAEMLPTIIRLTEHMRQLYKNDTGLNFIPNARIDEKQIPEAVALKHLLTSRDDLILKASLASDARSSYYLTDGTPGSPEPPEATLQHERQKRLTRINHALRWWADSGFSDRSSPVPNTPYDEDESDLEQMRIGVYPRFVHCDKTSKSVVSERKRHDLIRECYRSGCNHAVWHELTLEMEQVKPDIDCIDALIYHSASTAKSTSSSWFRLS